jgi:hypothetical protein
MVVSHGQPIAEQAQPQLGRAKLAADTTGHKPGRTRPGTTIAFQALGLARACQEEASKKRRVTTVDFTSFLGQ